MASKVRFSGSLYQNRHTFQLSGEQLTQESKDKLDMVANLYAESIMQAIATDGFGMWDMDTLWYSKKKARMKGTKSGTSGTAYEQTGALLGALDVQVSQEGPMRYRIWAGFKDGGHYSGYSISELVGKLDANRPLIAPAWERIKPQAMSILRSIGEGAFRIR